MRSIAASRVAGLALTALVLAGAAAAAPTFTVNSTVDAPGADTMGASLSDGVCETQHGNGICTLRAAIMESNHVPGGGATIVLPQGVYRIEIASAGHGDADGSFDIVAPMRIVGEGPSATIVDGNDADAVFTVQGGGVVLQDLTVRRGGNFGGMIVNFGGELTLENDALVEASGSGNRAIDNSGPGLLSLSHCIVARNTMEGGIESSVSGTVHIADSLIADNVVKPLKHEGGGVYNPGTMTIERTSILRNTSDGPGGGIFSGSGDLLLVNDTIARNQSGQGLEPAGGGGGVDSEGGSARLYNVTIADNGAIRYAAPSGAGIQTTPTAFLRNSILAGNFVGYVDEVDEGPSDCLESQPLVSGDYDLIGARATCSLTGDTDHVNASDLDPGLDPLGMNGGFAPDLRSSTFGPTTEVIPPASCVDPFGAPLTVDGRGNARVGACDIGADQLFGAYAPSPILGAELIRNGGAAGNELGLAAGDAAGSATRPIGSSRSAA